MNACDLEGSAFFVINDWLKSVMGVIAIGEGKQEDGLWEKRVSRVAVDVITNTGNHAVC